MQLHITADSVCYSVRSSRICLYRADGNMYHFHRGAHHTKMRPPLTLTNEDDEDLRKFTVSMHLCDTANDQWAMHEDLAIGSDIMKPYNCSLLFESNGCERHNHPTKDQKDKRKKREYRSILDALYHSECYTQIVHAQQPQTIVFDKHTGNNYIVGLLSWSEACAQKMCSKYSLSSLLLFHKVFH